MKVRLSHRHYPFHVAVNKDRARRLVKLVSELLLDEGTISEHKLNLVITYAIMVKKDINNQILKGEYANGVQEEGQEKVG